MRKTTWRNSRDRRVPRLGLRSLVTAQVALVLFTVPLPSGAQPTDPIKAAWFSQAPVAQTDWPTFHFSEDRAGVNPAESVLGPGNVYLLEQAWTFVSPGPIAAAPAVVNGIDYVQTSDSRGGILYAIDATNGDLLWTRKQPQPSGAFSDGATVVDGRVFLGTDLDYTLHVYDAAT